MDRPEIRCRAGPAQQKTLQRARNPPVLGWRRTEGERARNPNPKQPKSARPATMAALLRHGAARRVGGSMVQRAKAAFTTPAAAGERRLLTTEHARPGPPKDPPRANVRDVEEMKEELYDLLSLMDMTYMPKSYQNRQLFKFLSAQIKPRPHMSQWREMQASKVKKDVFDAIIFFSTCILGYEYGVQWLEERRYVAETTKKREQ